MTFRTRYGGEKERVSKELLGAIAAAQSLKDKIKLNQTITGETIGGFACLWAVIHLTGRWPRPQRTGRGARGTTI